MKTAINLLFDLKKPFTKAEQTINFEMKKHTRKNLLDDKFEGKQLLAIIIDQSKNAH